ncbi:sensor histidine kinase [Xanthomarina sp. F2636L]|uniref:sensor histidine kinase n=1 Tax=Xanthomarina sp. F2636L TaxID=2996018 RepID=UPI00225E20C6|nr:sensor histidine kinase [Xanthomarina sp. F2636L]MCX7551884.1 sensor histidine kinase [Xanthomarina sp. F2636L]
MKKLILVFLIVLFPSIHILSQPVKERNKSKDSIYKIEDFILTKQLDSATYFIALIKNKTPYLDLLSNIAFEKKLDYKAHYKFIVRVSNRKNVNYNQVSNYINTYIKAPKSNHDINLEYANIKIAQITKLRNEGALDDASRISKKLESYLNQFDQNNEYVIRTKASASSHTIVLHLIQEEIENGKEIIFRNIEIAKKFNDKTLLIKSLYHLSDFLIKEGKLQKYIDVCEEALEIENQLEQNTEYHYDILLHLIDAYIYKGGHENRVEELLNELYNNLNTRLDSYSLYAKYLSKLPTNSVIKKEVFKKFGVSNTKELAELFINETKGVLNLNDYYYVLIECSQALETDNYLKEAIRYQEEAVNVTRKVYSKDLSNSLATFKTEQAVKIKDLEIENQKALSNIYIVSVLLVAIFLIISLYFLRKSIKQSKALKEKNKIIDDSLKEKELLVKEVHHRVKNNFQIVSSLLELQIKDIEDEKALELATEGKNRVKSMALIHQKLYQNENGLIDFEEYIKLVVKELNALYASDKKIETIVESSGMQFDVDTAIPLGLIINEIITNSYKYAFNRMEGNKLYISIKKPENTPDYQLIIADNGPGLNKNIDLSKVKTLGLRLITRLVKQLHGALEQTNEEGAKFIITFKDIHARKSLN